MQLDIVEEWKPVVGFEEFYSVSNHGRLLRQDSGHMLKPYNSPKGYLKISFSINGSIKRKMAHRVVAEAFLGKPRDETMQVNHIDGNKTNNHITNLEYVTPLENTRHAIQMGLRRLKLTDDDVREIKRISGKKTQRAIATDFGITHKMVYLIQNGLIYADVA